MQNNTKLKFKPNHHTDKNYNYKNSGRLARIRSRGVSLDGQNCEFELGVIQYEYARKMPGHHFVITLNNEKHKKQLGFDPKYVEILDAEPH